MIEIYYYFSDEVGKILDKKKSKKLDRKLYELLYHAPIVAYNDSLIGLLGFKVKLSSDFDAAFYKKVEHRYAD